MGQKGKFVDVPIDCPQRDERLGWTGDAQIFIRTSAYLMNVAPFFCEMVKGSVSRSTGHWWSSIRYPASAMGERPLLCGMGRTSGEFSQVVIRLR